MISTTYIDWPIWARIIIHHIIPIIPYTVLYVAPLVFLPVLGMGRGKPRVTRGVSALGTQPSKFGWVGYPTQEIHGSPGRPMGFDPRPPLAPARSEGLGKQPLHVGWKLWETRRGDEEE